MMEVHTIAMRLMNISAKFETNQPRRSAGIVGTGLKNTVSRKTRLNFEVQKIRLSRALRYLAAYYVFRLLSERFQGKEGFTLFL